MPHLKGERNRDRPFDLTVGDQSGKFQKMLLPQCTSQSSTPRGVCWQRLDLTEKRDEHSFWRGGRLFLRTYQLEGDIQHTPAALRHLLPFKSLRGI